MDITIHRAQLVREAEGDEWHLTVEVTHDDGTVEPVGWSVPVATIMWKMGEYDLDPADIDGALELILFGFYAPRDQPTEILTADDLPAARRKWRQTVKTRRGKGKLRGIKLAGQRMAPVTEVVSGVVRAESGPDEDPLDMIRQRTPTITAEHVAAVRDHTDNRRRRIREERQMMAAVAEARANETAEQLRARLNPPTIPEGAPTVRSMPDQEAAEIIERMLDKRKARIREQEATERRATRKRERAAVVAEAEQTIEQQQTDQADRVAARRAQRKADADAEAARQQAAADELAATQKPRGESEQG